MRPLLALLAGFIASPTMAQNMDNCQPREEVGKVLLKEHDEQRVGMGISPRGWMIEVMASPEGSWTIIATAPNGCTGFIGNGEAWENITPPPLKKGMKM